MASWEEVLGIGAVARKVEDRIRWFVDEFRPRFIYVMFSGGKDSSVTLAAVVRASPVPVVAVYAHLAGQTHVDNVRAAYGVAERLSLAVFKTVVKQRLDLYRFMMRNKPWEAGKAFVHVVTTVYNKGWDYWEGTKHYGLEVPMEYFGRGKRWACADMKSKWFGELPPTGWYKGKQVHHVVVGIRREESVFRRRRWQNRIWQVFETKGRFGDDIALAPLVDVREADVWRLLKHYGIYDVVKPQYDRWGAAPNCMLCPLASRKRAEAAVKNMPTPLLKRVLSILEGLEPKGDWGRNKVEEWKEVINKELKRRGGTGGAQAH